jgi:hypothetical protein
VRSFVHAESDFGLLGFAANFINHRPTLSASNRRSQVQSGFYLAGVGLLNWTVLMRQMMQKIHANTTNVATYIGPGNSHCGDSEATYWTTSVRFTIECLAVHTFLVTRLFPSLLFSQSFIHNPCNMLLFTVERRLALSVGE